MQENAFTTFFTVNEDPAAVFAAIINFRGWWSEEIEGQTDKVGEEFFYHYKDVHLCKLRLVEKEANQLLIYKIVDNEFNFTNNKTEWIDSFLVFKINSVNDKTMMQFIHQGLVPDWECYNVCQDAWTSYIQGSLQELITTGKGKPNQKEGGLNAELIEKWGLHKK